MNSKLQEAFSFAAEKHRGQGKSGTAVPFVYHPMAVASLVLKYGGSDAQAQAALLHDTIGLPGVSESELASRFGEEVARLAYGFADPELPSHGATGWSDAKKAYLEKVRSLGPEVLLLIACEELHEVGELLHDLKYQGASVWKRYPAHSMEVFWYFRELLSILHSRLPGDRYRPLVAEFAGMVQRLKAICFDNAVY